MALLQISEPGQSPDPHQRRIAIGIDLGTTHSLVASVRNGVAECLPDTQGKTLLPSVVRYIDAQRRQIGWDAVAAQASDPVNTIYSAKRLMGRGMADINHAHSLPYSLQTSADTGMVGIQTVAGVKSPVEVSAEILATLRYRAEDTFNDDIFGAVITVPAYFDEAQRQATKDAAQLAGLKVLRLISEPTAAAIAYGLDNAAEGVYAVYDLGGGTFDISLLRLQQGVFEVIGTGGDSALGGDDYDRVLAEYLLTQCVGSEAVLAPTDKVTLQQTAKHIKEQLSRDETIATEINIKTQSHPVTVTRAQFDALTQGLTDKTMSSVKQVLRDAQLSPTEIDGVVLVGGSTRMPCIQQAVAAFFGQTPLTNLNPDEVVALGAAVQANQLAGNNPDGDLLLLDVIPLSLGLETMGGLVERIVPRNQTIPIAMAQDFTTYQDGQTALALHVVQGERDLVSDCRSLARFELRGIPPMAAGAARIRVTFTVDADGLLHVHAQELTSGVEAQVDVKPSYGLRDEDIARMLQEGFATAQQDMQARAVVEAKVDADRLILATQSALAVDGHMLDAAEQLRITEAIAHLQQAIQTSPHAAVIEQAAQALSAATEGFAAKRMNHSIALALKGRTIEQI